MTASPTGPYRITCPRRVTEQLRDWGREAAILGITQQYLDTLKIISANLAARPLEWGDPLYWLQHFPLLIRSKVILSRIHRAHDTTGGQKGHLPPTICTVPEPLASSST